ncbi:MAG: beta-N-acetylhexosaminidase [Bacteroidetes bacterium]|nr:beta-N-acetylhexosaminidase [Bacteroidota bacterium]
MKIITIILSVFLSGVAFAQQPISIIPRPAEMRVGTGKFIVSPNTALVPLGNDPEVRRIAGLLNEKLKIAAGFTLKTEQTQRKDAIHFKLINEPALGNEGYRLHVTGEDVTIAANKSGGLFYGLQSLFQLLPYQIEGKSLITNFQWSIPVVEIRDVPRFGWRGQMLDVSRHFFTKDEVKSFIDDMAQYKYNLLHFHLTDDQGWRIEIKQYPKLTSVGAWNVKKEGRFGAFSPPAVNEPRDYGGFYTQDDIRELIRYAKDRYVEILPEIESPGHSLAAIASYPELSYTPGTYVVNSGETFMDWFGGGKFAARVDNTLCPANDKVYEFLDKVLGEVAQLFPFPYIHMGGDECAKNFWEKNPQIKSLMAREKLGDMDAVQSYFVGRVSSIITSKGKKMIGWDEILEGGLVKSAAVMSWRGMKGGIEAAKKGHEVVMTPSDFVYVDYMQGDAALEPPVYATLRLKKTYQFEPVPEGVNANLIKGGQANLWTEQIYNMRHLRYMLWPRGFAIAEALWSPKSARDWKGFVPRVEEHFKRFEVSDRKYAPSMYEPVVNVKRSATGGFALDFDVEVPGVTVHYSFDHSFPDNFYPAYSGKSIVVPVDATVLRVVSYTSGRLVGRTMTISIADLKKRVK